MSDGRRDDATAAAALSTLLSLNIGYGVEFMGTLSLYQLEDLHFAVVRTDGTTALEETFADVNEAVSRFLHLRTELRLGYDFENQNTNPEE